MSQGLSFCSGSLSLVPVASGKLTQNCSFAAVFFEFDLSAERAGF